MKAPTFEQLIGGILAIGGLGVVSFVVITTGNETALGAMVGVLTGATGFYIRGRLETKS